MLALPRGTRGGAGGKGLAGRVSVIGRQTAWFHAAEDTDHPAFIPARDLTLGRAHPAMDRLLGMVTPGARDSNPMIALWSIPDLVEAAARAHNTTPPPKAETTRKPAPRLTNRAGYRSHPRKMGLAVMTKGDERERRTGASARRTALTSPRAAAIDAR
jgi:hypothetical protein